MPAWMWSSAGVVCPFSVILLQVTWGGDPSTVAPVAVVCQCAGVPGSVTVSWLCSGSLGGSAQLTVISYNLSAF